MLVTGARGFLGMQVLKPLVDRSYEVHAVGRADPSQNTSPTVYWHKADLLIPSQVDKLLHLIKPAGLLHFAWDTTPGSYWNSSLNLDWTAATLHLLRMFSAAGGQRAVLAGTSAEYLWGEQEPLDETRTPLLPASLYGTCKNAVREILQSWATLNGISWAWGRIFNIFGPFERDERLIPRVIRTLLSGEALSFDDGRVYRDFLHVADAGEAFAALFASKVSGPINVASGDAVKIRDVISTIATHLGAQHLVRFGALANNPKDRHPIVANVKRLHSELGWKASNTLSNRLRETTDWWRKLDHRDHVKRR